MSIRIKIAPDLKEVRLHKNVVSTEFNGMKLAYEMPDEYQVYKVNAIKEAFRTAIAMVSKTTQIEWVLNEYFHWEGKLKVERI